MRHGEPIENVLPYTDVQLDAGIAFRIQLQGCIPFFEEYAAMVEANYSAIEWEQLSSQEKADAVAHYRLKRHIALHEADAAKLKQDSERKR